MMLHRYSALLLASTVVLTGCADFGGPIGGSGGAGLSPEERRLQDLENKTAQMQRRLDTLINSGLDQETTRLRDEVRALRGDIEQLRHDADAREKASKDQYQELDRRLQKFEGGQGLAGGAGTIPGSSPGTISAVNPQQSTVASPEEETAYLATFDLLKNGKYDEAIRGFREMLDKWPQGRYADNAWYWMGEANFVKRDYGAALNSFKSLVEKFPSSAKLPDALLKVGLSSAELKRTGEARTALQRVIRDFPNSNAANLAKQKLEQLGG